MRWLRWFRRDVPDYVQEYELHWADIVENRFGFLKRDQVMRELSDYLVVMDNASEVYSELAGLSKPNTAAVWIIEGAEKKFQEIHADQVLDELLDVMDTDEARRALIEFANDMAPGAYERHLKDCAWRSELRAEVDDPFPEERPADA